MKKFCFILFLVLLPSIILQGGLEEKVYSIIAKNIDGNRFSFVYLAVNDTKQTYFVPEFTAGNNMLYLTFTRNNFMPLGVINISLFTVGLNPGVTFWKKDDTLEYIRMFRYIENITFFTQEWQLSLWADQPPVSSRINFLQTRNIDVSGIAEAGKISCRIAKSVNAEPLGFALLISNGLAEKVRVPDFNTAGSRVKIKFPSGKIFNAPVTDEDKKLTLRSNSTRCCFIDLERLLQSSHEFSMKDFEFGLSELIWEVTLPDGSINTQFFYLIKFSAPLPGYTGYGFKLNGSLNDMETFKANKISILPPARPRGPTPTPPDLAVEKYYNQQLLPSTYLMPQPVEQTN